MSDKHIYKIVFVNQEQVYEIYARNVYQGEWYGFIIIEDFIFGEKSTIVIDPAEEKLRNEFEGVERCFVPLHHVLRIDQVKKRGTAKIVALGKEGAEGYGKVSPLHSPEKK